MAKRRIEHASTGIYRPSNETVADGKDMPVAWNEAARERDQWTIDAVIAEVERAAKCVLAPYTGDMDGEPRPSSEHPYLLPKPFPRGTKPHEIGLATDAHHALWKIHRLRYEMAKKKADWRLIAVQAFHLGRLAERMNVRLFEPHAKRGKGTLRSASTGGKTTSAPHRAKWPQYQADVEAAMKANKRLSYSAACASVAKKHDKHADTVKNRTTNPKPRKPNK